MYEKDNALDSEVPTGMAKSFLMVGVIVALGAWSVAIWSAHPLITEDTGIQGKGKTQLEAQLERGHENELGTTETSVRFASVLSWGFHDFADVILSLPYERITTRADGETIAERGRGDVGVDVKWRFHEAGKMSLALKSGLVSPTGDEARGLGDGKTNYSLLFISSFDYDPWALHAHVGYLRHRNLAEERGGVRHASIGGWRRVEKFKFAFDVGRDTSVDRRFDAAAAFGIFGVIYSPNRDLDLDFGVKWGLRDPEVDRTLLIGATLRF